MRNQVQLDNNDRDEIDEVERTCSDVYTHIYI